jgi:hypothetical protein
MTRTAWIIVLLAAVYLIWLEWSSLDGGLADAQSLISKESTSLQGVIQRAINSTRESATQSPGTLGPTLDLLDLGAPPPTDNDDDPPAQDPDDDDDGDDGDDGGGYDPAGECGDSDDDDGFTAELAPTCTSFEDD